MADVEAARAAWNVAYGWRWMFTAVTVPSVLFFVGALFVPESPRWLQASGARERARRVLARIGGEAYAAVGAGEWCWPLPRVILRELRGQDKGHASGDDVRVRSSPAADGGMVFVGAGPNTLAAVNLTSGALVWNRQLGAPVAGKYLMSSPAVVENRLFVGADALYALNARTGVTVWSYAPGDWFWSSPGISAASRGSFRGTVFVVSEGGELCAWIFS